MKSFQLRFLEKEHVKRNLKQATCLVRFLNFRSSHMLPRVVRIVWLERKKKKRTISKINKRSQKHTLFISQYASIRLSAINGFHCITVSPAPATSEVPLSLLTNPFYPRVTTILFPPQLKMFTFISYHKQPTSFTVHNIQRGSSESICGDGSVTAE